MCVLHRVRLPVLCTSINIKHFLHTKIKVCTCISNTPCCRYNTTTININECAAHVSGDGGNEEVQHRIAVSITVLLYILYVAAGTSLALVLGRPGRIGYCMGYV